jgi:protease I
MYKGIPKDRVLMIISKRNFRDEELLEPKRILEENNYLVDIANEKGEESVGMYGTRIEPQLNFSKIVVNDYEAIIFVGGQGAMDYWNNTFAQKMAKEAYLKGKILGAICMAVGTLANAKLIKGKKVTGWPDVKDLVIKAGGIYTEADIEIAGRIITAKGPKQAQKFGEEILKLLKIAEKAKYDE